MVARCPGEPGLLILRGLRSFGAWSLAGSCAFARGVNGGGRLHGGVARIGDCSCGGAVGPKLAAAARKRLLDARRGVPLNGTGAARAGELDAVSVGDGGEAGRRTLLVGGAGLPGFADASCADADLPADRLAGGRSDGGSDLPFAGLELGAGSLGAGNRKENERKRCDETREKWLHIAVQIITGVAAW